MIEKKITPFLWFDDNGEEAMNFYISVFKNSKIQSISRQGDNGPMFTGTFEAEGQDFVVLNGGPHFKFNEAVSFVISCKDQEEVDHYWNALIANGGEESRCGWLKDKYGLSWQVVPKALMELMGDADPVKSERVMQAMMKMNKLIVADLQAAYDQA